MCLSPSLSLREGFLLVFVVVIVVMLLRCFSLGLNMLYFVAIPLKLLGIVVLIFGGCLHFIPTNLVHDRMDRERNPQCLSLGLGMVVVFVILVTVVFLMHGMLLWYLSLCLNLRRIVLMTFVHLMYM